MTWVTIIRPGDPGTLYDCPVDDPSDPCAVVNTIAESLSSPLLSYNITEHPDIQAFEVKHNETYVTRFKALKTVFQQHEDITIDWEVRSRIAQGLHDSCRDIVPKAPHARLSAKGFKYLPRLLSIWAVENVLEPVPSLLPVIDDDELDDIINKAQILKREGLDADANLVWNAVGQEARNVMVTMWLTRESRARSAIAHPIPTAGQAQEVINSVPNLSAEAKVLAQTVVTFGVDKKGATLFTP